MAMTPGIELSGNRCKQLSRFAEQTKDKQEYRAARGVLLRSKGRTAQRVGEELGVSKKQVYVWCQLFKKFGVDGLRRLKSPGRPAPQKNKAKERIPELLKKAPEAFGFLKGRWVVRDIATELQKEGIKLHRSGVHRALRELGVVLREPKLRAPGSIKKNYKKRAQIKRYKRIAAALFKKKS